jgi:hypothetical protein
MAPLTHHRALRFWRPLAVVLALMALSAARAAAPVPSAEYKLKAVFLFNFAQFVEWPTDAFANDSAPLVIGVLGADPFGSYLDDLVRGEKIGAHPLEVRRLGDGEARETCHILFVSDSEADRVEPLLKGLRGRHVLTVSDVESFARTGGMVRFVLEDGKIRLRVNLGAARAAHLVISSKILRVATIVSSERD